MEEAGARLTEQQSRVVEAFRRSADDGLPPPTYRELCRKFGWRSTGTARDHIRALVRKGVLRSADGRSRGACLQQPRPGGKLLPLVGCIVAGRPVASEEHVEREIMVPDELVPSGKAFLLRVSGDSMEGAGILAGDLVVVKETRNARPGTIVAVTLEGETTLKTLRQQRGRWVLAPANPKYSAIEINSPATIRGVVTAVMRIMDGKPTQTVVARETRTARVRTREGHS